MKSKIHEYQRNLNNKMSKKMKSTLVMAFAIVCTTHFVSCSNVQDSTTDEVQTSISKEQASELLNNYLKVKNALVETDGEAASAAAIKLVEALGDNQDELAKKIRFDSEHISETKDEGQQRDHLNILSDNIYILVKATRANDSKLYRQYCPMAFDNKGAFWLSAEKQVNNPYFGDKMLHCGSVKEEL